MHTQIGYPSFDSSFHSTESRDRMYRVDRFLLYKSSLSCFLVRRGPRVFTLLIPFHYFGRGSKETGTTAVGDVTIHLVMNVETEVRLSPPSSKRRKKVSLKIPDGIHSFPSSLSGKDIEMKGERFLRIKPHFIRPQEVYIPLSILIKERTTDFKVLLLQFFRDDINFHLTFYNVNIT